MKLRKVRLYNRKLQHDDESESQDVIIESKTSELGRLHTESFQ